MITGYEHRYTIDINTGCWNWRSSDRGRIKKKFAYRVIYELVKGPIPAGLVVDHLCRNARCVNPDHLEVVTHSENIKRGKQALSSTDYRGLGRKEWKRQNDRTEKRRRRHWKNPKESILLHHRPPNNIRATSEYGLWWAVIRQSAQDIEQGYEQQAIDGYEFLKSTGLWLLITYFRFTEEDAVTTIADLVRRYYVRTGIKLARNRV